MNESLTIQAAPYFSDMEKSHIGDQKERSADACNPDSLLGNASPLARDNLQIRPEPRALSGTLANALVRAYEGLEGLQLTENARRVLACLLRYGLDLKNYKAQVFIKKTTVAKKLDINEATVYRALTTLEAAKLIVRNEQLKFKAISTITFTDVALDRLGLVEKENSNLNKNNLGPDHTTPQTTLAPMQDVNSKPIQSFSKRQSDRAHVTRIGEQLVPTDLAWLVTEKGLVPNAVFSLMGIATKHGHRLSNVVAHAVSAIRSTKIKNVFAYIRALVGKKIDYEFLANQAAEAKSLAKLKDERSRTIVAAQSAMVAFVGKTFKAPDGKHWTVEDGVFVTASGNVRTAISFHQAPNIAVGIANAAWPIVGASHVEDLATESLSRMAIPSSANHARAVLAELRNKLRK